MKQKKSKVVYTPNKSFECKIPLGWGGIVRNLIIAVNRYNQKELRIWKESSFFHQLFTYPANYKVEVKASGVAEMMKLYPRTNYHQVWIENTRNKRMHFDLLCKKPPFTSSKFLQDGVKYTDFLLMSEDISTRWLDKKNAFLREIIQFIRFEVS